MRERARQSGKNLRDMRDIGFSWLTGDDGTHLPGFCPAVYPQRASRVARTASLGPAPRDTQPEP